jgi:hypothetical protein
MRHRAQLIGGALKSARRQRAAPALPAYSFVPMSKQDSSKRDVAGAKFRLLIVDDHPVVLTVTR